MISSRHVRPKILSLLVIAGMVFFTTFCWSAPDLVDIPHPDLKGLERVIILQIVKGRQDVAAIAENPESSTRLMAITYGDLGHLYHTYDFLDAAAAAYYNAAQLQSDVFRWNYCVAYVAQEQGDFEKALIYYKKARDQEVTNDLIYLVNIRIGECYKKLNNLENASQAYEIARAVNPEGPTIHARLGELHLAKKNYEKAINHLSLALTLNPDANKLHSPLAMAYRILGEKDLDMYHLSRRGRVGLQPPDPLKKKLDSLLRGYRVHILEGKVAFSAKRYEEAALSFKKAIAEDPNQASAWINLSAVNSQLQNNAEALANLEHALKIEPDNETVHFNIGSLYLTYGDYGKSIEHLNTFMAVKSDDSQALAKLAKAYYLNKQYQESVEKYKDSLRLDHTQAEIWFEFIAMLESLGEYEAAFQAENLAAEKLPRNKKILAKLAYTLATSPSKELRNGSKAVEIALQLYQLQADYQTARIVAMSYAQADQCKEATAWMEKTISMAKESSQNDEVLLVLQRNKEHFAANIPCRIP